MLPLCLQGLDRQQMTAAINSAPLGRVDRKIALLRYVERLPLPDIAAQTHYSRTAIGYRLKGIEKMLNDECINNKYDYVICDCGLLLDVTVLNVVKASDLLIIPVKAGGYGIDAVENMIEQTKGIHEGQQVKVLMTMKTGNITNKDTAQWLRDTYKDKMFKTEIRRSVVAEKAETAKRPLPEMSRGSNAAKDYNNVIREIMTDEEWNAAQAYIESKRRNKKTGRFQKVD